jgi:hypothetical protein
MSQSGMKEFGWKRRLAFPYFSGVLRPGMTMRL